MTKKIFITGASSGIGWAIAKQLDAQNVTLGLVGRNKKRLLALQKQLQCTSFVLPAHVENVVSMQKAADKFKQLCGCPDIVIANAGVSSGTLAADSKDLEIIQKIFHLGRKQISGNEVFETPLSSL